MRHRCFERHARAQVYTVAHTQSAVLFSVLGVERPGRARVADMVAGSEKRKGRANFSLDPALRAGHAAHAPHRDGRCRLSSSRRLRYIYRTRKTSVLRGKRLASESGATSTSSTAAAVLDHADHADRRS